MKDLFKRFLSVVLTEVILVGILSFGLNEYVLTLMGGWSWWQFVIMIAVLLLVAGLIYGIIEWIQKKKKKGRERKMERKVADFQLEVMQAFLRIQMESAFGAGWTQQVKTVVENKFANQDAHKQNYQGIYDVIRKEGIETLDEKDMDVTGITALMLYDFYMQCKVGTNFRQQVRNIQTDKNKLVSHIPDPQDVLNVKILELTALKSLRSFLTYLQNSDWTYADKQQFVNRYMEQIEEITGELFQDVVGDEQDEMEFASNRIHYLNKLIGEKEENAAQYLPLEYKVNDEREQRYLLENLNGLSENQKGFVLFADAGYGKSWSIQELAGNCAQAAIQEKNGKITPVLIKMGQVAPHGEPILKTVQECLFPGEESLEKAREFLQKEEVVLYVDGMDEADSHNKENVRKEMIRLQDTCRQIRIIGGTRESDIRMFPDELKKYSICNLTDGQVEQFIIKLIPEEAARKKALFDYFENPSTNFLRNLRSPFYLKCYIDFIQEGETNPGSDTDMMERCVNAMVEREIKLKGFRASIPLVNEILLKLSEILGERRYVRTAEALKCLREEVVYDTDEMASIVQIKDTLVEMQILREVEQVKIPPLLGFGHEKYKDLYSPIANDGEMWDY